MTSKSSNDSRDVQIGNLFTQTDSRRNLRTHRPHTCMRVHIVPLPVLPCTSARRVRRVTACLAPLLDTARRRFSRLRRVHPIARPPSRSCMRPVLASRILPLPDHPLNCTYAPDLASASLPAPLPTLHKLPVSALCSTSCTYSQCRAPLIHPHC